MSAMSPTHRAISLLHPAHQPHSHRNMAASTRLHPSTLTEERKEQIRKTKKDGAAATHGQPSNTSKVDRQLHIPPDIVADEYQWLLAFAIASQ